MADLFAGQVDAMEEKHHEDADVHDPFRMHCATRGAEAGEEIRQQRGEQHAAQEPVGHHAFEVSENLHRAPQVVRKVDLA